MAIIQIIGAIKPLAKLLLKGLELIDPKTRDWVRKRKALEFAEQYILKNEQLLPLLEPREDLTVKELRKMKSLFKGLRFRKKWFFQYD